MELIVNISKIINFMPLNYPNNNLNFPEIVSEYIDLKSLSEYLNNLVKQYCISELHISESNYEHSSAPYGQNNRTNFKLKLVKYIQSHIENSFKNWLHINQPSDTFKFSFIQPTNKQLEDIKEWNIEWVLWFKIIKRIKPRYIKDWDTREYSFIFDLYINARKKNDLNISHLQNWMIIESWNTDYRISILQRRKTKAETEARDASIKRSREAYRQQLMRVVRSWSFSKK